MGRSIYFTNKELSMVRSYVFEAIDILGNASDTAEQVDEDMKNGLGSALRKLYKGCIGEITFYKESGINNMGYIPKVYDCTINGIKCINGENLFLLHWKDSKNDGNMPIQVDQPAELIVDRMKEIVAGKRDKLYLTRGMRDIDVSYLGDNKWQLYDEFDFYEFEMNV